MKKVVLFKSESEEYLRAFGDRNYDVIFIEPLQFLYLNAKELSEKLQQGEYDGLIVTSPRAAEAINKCWDPSKLELWSTKRIYTIGEASAQKIKLLLGLEATGVTAGNAENLAKLIVNENKDNSKFLFPCGNLRSETLPSILKNHNIQLDSLMVYETHESERLRNDLMKLNSSTDDPCGMVFFSPSGCEYIYRQLQTFSNKLSQLPHFAIGNSTAHKIENLGVEIAGVASKPKADCLVESVQTYFNTNS